MSRHVSGWVAEGGIAVHPEKVDADLEELEIRLHSVCTTTEGEVSYLRYLAVGGFINLEQINKTLGEMG